MYILYSVIVQYSVIYCIHVYVYYMYTCIPIHCPLIIMCIISNRGIPNGFTCFPIPVPITSWTTWYGNQSFILYFGFIPIFSGSCVIKNEDHTSDDSDYEGTITYTIGAALVNPVPRPKLQVRILAAKYNISRNLIHVVT